MPESLWWTYDWMHLSGRVLFGMLFIGSGLSHLMQHKTMTAYAQSKGIPAPGFYVAVTGVQILVGGALVALGWHRFIGAGLLVLFLLLAAFLMHAFWRESDPAVKSNEMAHFMKDLALAGAALFIAYYGGGSWPHSIGG